MNKVILFFIALAISKVVDGQGSSFQWAKSVGGNNNDYGNVIATDVSGNVYISGTFIGKADFNPGLGSDTLNSATGASYLMKLDATGNYVWAKNFDYTITSMKCDASGNIISTGYFQNTVDFDIGSGTFSMSGYATNGYKDIFVTKIDVSGNFVWAKQVGGNFIDQAFAITLDATDNIYYTGQFGYGSDFDPGPSTYTLATISGPNTDCDIFVSKLDPSGNFLWAKAMGGTYDEKGLSIVTDGSGNVYTTGVFEGSTDFDPGVLYYPMASAGSLIYDVFISKLDALGNFVWAKSVSGPSNTHKSNTIAIDGANNLYISGYFEGTVDFDPGSSTYTLTTTGGSSGDAFVMKLNNSGSFMWAKNFGGIYGDATSSMVLDASANIYTTGSFNGIADFDPGSGTYNLKITNIPFQGSDDVFISKLDSAGNLVWAENFGGLYADVAKSIAIDVSGNIYTTGYYTESGDFDAGGTTYSLTATAASVDVFIHKMSPCGSAPAPVNITNTSNQTICSGNSSTFSVTGTPTIYWYDNNNPGAVIASGFTYAPPATLASGVYTYYAETSFCTSAGSRTPLSFSVIPTPTITVNNGAICAGQSFTIMPAGANTYTISGGSSIVSPTVNTTYSITGSSSNGCVNNVGTVCNLTVNITPTINVVCSPTLVCFGSGCNLSQTGAVFIHWSYQAGSTYGTGSSGYINPTVTTTYSVDGYDSNFACHSSKTFTVFVEPGMTVIADKDTVCVGSSSSFTVNGVSGYNIQPPPTATTSVGFVVTPSVTTYYYFNGSTSAGCSYGTSQIIKVDNTCADVWPGDANSDGVADNLDVLELGLHYTQTGAPRVTSSNAWQSYFSNNWAGTITNGKNVNHSDCNGDGMINDDDTLAIYNNYGLIHAFKGTPTTTVNPQVSIVPDQTAVLTGNWGTASIYLGDVINNINSVNGVAFTVDFDNSLIDANSIYIEYQPSFIDASQNLHFRKLDFANGKLFTATTHTISNNVSGNGKIATLHYQIKSGLTSDQVLNIGLSEANQSNASGTIVPLTTGTETVMAIASSVGLLENINNSYVSVSPNPTNGLLSINSKTELQKIEIISITGQVLLSEIPTSINHQLHLESFANGIYFVNVYQNNHIVKREKVVLNK